MSEWILRLVKFTLYLNVRSRSQHILPSWNRGLLVGKMSLTAFQFEQVAHWHFGRLPKICLMSLKIAEGPGG